MANKINAPRKMPYSIEAEQSVLGSMLISNVVASELGSQLTSNDFYSDIHKTIFSNMQTLLQRNQPVDYVTLVSELEKIGKLDEIGGINYITTLTNVVPTASNYKHYADIVLEDSRLCKLMNLGKEINAKSYDSEDSKEIVEFIERSLTDITTQQTGGLEQIAGGVNEVSKKLEDIAKNPNAVTGLKTGFYGIDKNFNGGLQKGDLILIAARPGVGKTSIAMNIVANCALNESATCAVFSLEMPKTQLAQRMLCSVANVDMSKALKGELDANDWNAIWVARKKLIDSNIYVDDNSLTTTSVISNECERLKREHGLDLIMIDYVQLMNSAVTSKAQENRQQEVSNITRNLKILAKSLNVPILLLSQLSREVEKRPDHRPMLADLRESGAREQDADSGTFLYNPDMYAKEDAPKKNIIDFMVAKHRN